MMKIYSNETNASKEKVGQPKESVINAILNFSKSLEVIQLKPDDLKQKKNVEVTLN